MKQFNPVMKDSQLLRTIIKPEVDVDEFIGAVELITSTNSLMLELRNIASDEELALLKGRNVCVIDTSIYLDVVKHYIRDEFQAALTNSAFSIVALVQTYEGTPYVTININNYKLQSKLSRIEVLNHELFHIHQIERGDLELFEDTPIVKWKGVEYNIMPPANETHEAYMERQLSYPWEVEAYYFHAPACTRAYHGEQIVEAYNRTFK